MPNPPQLLNDDGTASIATALMSSHHGFRRDIAQFRKALRRVADGDHTRVGALREEWQRYGGTLHHHHQAEDSGIFPGIRQQHPELAAIIDGLVKPTFDGVLALPDLGSAVTEARAAAMPDPRQAALKRKIAEIRAHCAAAGTDAAAE